MSPEDRRAAPPVIVEPPPGSIADMFKELLPNVEMQAIQGARDVVLVVSEDAHGVLVEAKNNPRLTMDYLRDLTGVDFEAEGFEVVYQLWSYQHRHGVTVRAKLPLSGPLTIPSATDLWQAADWHERETRDMFGIEFEGHPNLVPLLLPDDMLDHFPLRKDNPLAPLEEWQGVQLGDEMGRAGYIPPGSGIEVKAEAD